MSKQKVAFIGLGVMGFPMAGHLAVKGGHDVTVYNRSRAKAAAWVAKHGGRLADTPAKAAEGAQIVFSCVGDDPEVLQRAAGEVLISDSGAAGLFCRQNQTIIVICQFNDTCRDRQFFTGCIGCTVDFATKVLDCIGICH